jgi:hypothetical protein
MQQRFEQMERAVSLRIEGKNPAQIAKSLGLTRVEVDNLLVEWRDIVLNDKAIVQRTREALANTDIHYNQLIQKGYEVVEEADSDMECNGFDSKSAAQKLSALKLIGDLESKRFSMLKEMGAIDNSEMASAIAERERREEIMIGIIRDVVFKCPTCQSEVKRRIAQITGDAVPVEVIG